MKKFVLVFIASGLGTLLWDCNFSATGGWRNDNIDAGIRKEIASLDKKLFEAVMHKDVAGVKQMMSPVLIEKAGDQVDTVVNTIANGFKADDYDIVDEYYTKNSSANVPNTVFSANGSVNDYSVGYIALNKEMYVSLLSSKSNIASCLIMAIYGKYGNGWKLNILQMGAYKMFGKSAQDYYQQALTAYNKENLVDACDYIITASQLANPANTYFKYKNEGEMKSFFDKVLQQANAQYKFPITVTSIQSKPQLFAINPQPLNEKTYQGIFPLIKYRSNIPFSDTASLKAENTALQKLAGSLFKGINQNKSCVLYSAFDQLPNSQPGISNVSKPQEHRFIQKLN